MGKKNMDVGGNKQQISLNAKPFFISNIKFNYNCFMPAEGLLSASSVFGLSPLP
jgi:hypothetical protein